MTGASTMSLIAMFGVDLVDMFSLTLLGEHELAAAVGLAGPLLSFLVAVSIGLQIAMGALVARHPCRVLWCAVALFSAISLVRRLESQYTFLAQRHSAEPDEG
jgi:hypothetical protein